MPRCLFLATDYSGESGGISQMTRDLILALSEYPGMEVVVLARRASETKHFPDKVSFLKARPNKFMYALSALNSCIADRSFDLIICSHLHMSRLAVLLAKRWHVPLWIHLYGVEAWKAPHALLKKSVESTPFFTAISRYTRRQFLSWAHVNPIRVKLLPPAWHPLTTDGVLSREWAAKQGLLGKKVLLTVARLSSEEKYKGQDRVIRILPRLLHKHELVYLIVGSGDDKSRLIALAHEYKVSKNVIFLDQVRNSELTCIYQSSDVFVMPSTGEGFGIVFLEAASSGIPVIGGNQDGSADALMDGTIGSMIDPNNEQVLYDAIDHALTSKKVGAPKALEQFAFHHFRDHMHQLLDGIYKK